MSGLTIGSLCTGILGLDRAVADHFDADLAWVSEIEPAAVTVIEREHPEVPNLGDLTAVDWADVPPVDILTAGYPCQPFSHAGKRQGASDVRHLWPFIIDAVRHLRPRWVVAENVRGHLSLGFDRVLWSLAEAGFDAEWCVLRASDVGACHQRARVFLVASDTASNEGRLLDGDRQVGHPADADGVAGAPTVTEHWGPCPVGEQEPVEGAQRLRGMAAAGVDWGKYAPAVERWAALFGRPAPHPVDDAGRLSPRLVEWMMGYPEGWVDGLTRTQALKALGNAVVTQQAAAALRELAPMGEVAPMPVAGHKLTLLPTPTANQPGGTAAQHLARKNAMADGAKRTSVTDLRMAVDLVVGNETLPLLPTPVVNDMGARKTPAEWDAWCADMKARHGNGNGHGNSLSIEAQRVAQ